MSRILVTGASGFLGSYVLAQLGEAALPLPGRTVYDLRLPSAMHDALADYRPDAVIHLAYPGTDGIGTMIDQPADLVRQTLQIDLNVIHACARMRVGRLITVGSVCSYPEHVQDFPTTEAELWNGAPEPINAAYGEAKRMQLELLRSYRRQYGLQSTQLILANLYGPGDRSGHVLPALIQRMQHAHRTGTPLTVWGTGLATREFLHVADAARALVRACEVPDCPLVPINICTQREVRLGELVDHLARLTRFSGVVQWDPTRPEGQRRRRFSNARAWSLLQWRPQVPWSEGLAQTVAWWASGAPPRPDPTVAHRAGPAAADGAGEPTP